VHTSAAQAGGVRQDGTAAVMAADSTRADIAAVRDAVRAGLHGTPAASRAEDVVLVASELLSNAFRHAGGWWCARLTVERDRLVLSVEDSLAVPPRPRTPDLGGGGGLGWHLVQRLTDGVEVELRGEGKTIRAHWLLPAAGEPPAAG
jgi:anti-sigma regulatory factor (Ser/Thr protein kinase)